LPPDQILNALTDRLLIMKIMMLFQQAIEQRLISRAAHQLKLQGTQFAQLTFDRCAID
jgi:hypothetical protein